MAEQVDKNSDAAIKAGKELYKKVEAAVDAAVNLIAIREEEPTTAQIVGYISMLTTRLLDDRSNNGVEELLERELRKVFGRK